MKGRSAGRIICWDLDETTGSFRDYRRMGLTKGMEPLLERLSGLGFRHVITTAASREHAEYVLWQAGVRDLYEAIFSAPDICDQYYNKFYAPVAMHFKLDPGQAQSDILVVGNLSRDAPADLDLTFLYHPKGCEYEASVFWKIIGRLMENSDSWADAHAMLAGQNAYSVPVPDFTGGQQYIEGIWASVGRFMRNVSPQKPSDRIIAIHSIPDCFRSDIELLDMKEKDEKGKKDDACFTQPAQSP